MGHRDTNLVVVGQNVSSFASEPCGPLDGYSEPSPTHDGVPDRWWEVW